MVASGRAPASSHACFVVSTPTSLPLENRRNAHAARGADRDEPAAAAALLEQLRERADEPRTGGRERMPDRDAAALDVELRAIDCAECGRLAELRSTVVVRLPRLQRAEHLRGERLVNLIEVEVLEPQARALEQPRNG